MLIYIDIISNVIISNVILILVIRVNLIINLSNFANYLICNINIKYII